MPEKQPVVGIAMGSDSDLDVMSPAASVFEDFGVPFEVRFISAHRTPDAMAEYGKTAAKRGLQVIIAGAGGSAHLPGMLAAYTHLPVIGVPVKRPDHAPNALGSMIDMPKGVPLATMPENGAMQAAQLAIRILSLNDPELQARYIQSREEMANAVLEKDAVAKAGNWKKFLKKP